MIRILLALIAKDHLRRLRAPLGFLVVLSFPIVFALMLAVTFGTGEEDAPRIRLLVENRDDDFIGGVLMSALTSDQIAEHFDIEVTGEEGEGLLEDRRAAALLRIPSGFTRDLLEGIPTAVELVRNPAQGILPEIAEQLAGVLTEMLDSASRTLRRDLDLFSEMRSSGASAPTDNAVASLAISIKRTIEGVEDYLFPPAITLESVTLEAAGEESRGSAGAMATIFLVILPGVAVYALFLVGDLAMRDILTEEADGTLRRQLCGPIGTGTLLVGKVLFTATLSGLSLVILAIVAGLAGGRGSSLLAFLVLSLGLILAVTGAAALLYGSAGNERRASTIGAIVYLVLAFAGGSFVSLESLPASVRSVAPLSPFYWGTTGFRAILESGAGVVDILPNTGILALIGTICLLAGSFMLRRTVGRGVNA